MAKKRDIVIAVIIIFSFAVTIGFFGLMFFSAFFGADDGSIGGFGERIAVVEVFGTISNSEPTVKQLKKYGQSESIKAIILHVDSPGGGVAASQEIYDEILRIREEEGKTVVVSMSSTAASGGYLIACAADTIMANPGTLTGSIGVILQYPTVGRLFEKIGVKYETVKSGELKDVGNFTRDMTVREREMLEAMIKDTYEQFVDIVCAGRGLDRDSVYKIADGSIFSGRQAQQLGLVDTLGGFEDAVRMTAKMVGISGEPKIVKEIRPKRGVWDLVGSLLGQVDETASGEIGGPRIMYLY